MHTESDDELRHILEKIFANFEQKKMAGISSELREKKTEIEKAAMDCQLMVDVTVCVQEMNEVRKTIDEPNKVPSVVRNIATSVIKFAGRSQNVQESTENVGEKQVKTPIVEPVEPEPCRVEQEEPPNLIAIEPDSVAEISVNLPSLEPLNFDTFPENMAPLPLINTNTNLSVYRQLLSPYLKKQPSAISNSESSKTESNDELIECHKKNFKTSSTTAMVIDRPPKKMIEKYEIYRK